ncbi:MAG: hypothetical protein AAFR07_05610 [Pseudomonadota bacterium]
MADHQALVICERLSTILKDARTAAGNGVSAFRIRKVTDAVLPHITVMPGTNVSLDAGSEVNDRSDRELQIMLAIAVDGSEPIKDAYNLAAEAQSAIMADIQLGLSGVLLVYPGGIEPPDFDSGDANGVVELTVEYLVRYRTSLVDPTLPR